MIEFNEKQKAKAQNVFLLLKKQTPEWLEKNGLTKCEKCDGTGLAAVKYLSGRGYSWSNTDAYCEKCYGLGHLGYNKRIDFGGTKYTCSTCQSVGCKECDNTGFVDWITHIMRKGKK